MIDKAIANQSPLVVDEARRVCLDLMLTPQQPAMYRRAHNALVAEIDSVVPVDVVKSIDELACPLDEGQRRDPEGLSARIKAGIACAIGKPNGLTFWHPADMPAPLLALPMDDIPGVGNRMKVRLGMAQIFSTEGLQN